MERPRRAELLTLLVLALAPAAAPAQTGEPVVVRLNDAVGDTVDRAERDSFGLFPNAPGFQDAVILALPGPEFYARVTRDGADSATPVFLRIMPTDLERIRFLIDNHESVAEQQGSDSTYAQALAAFWHTIEDYPLRSIAGGPAVVEEAAPPRQAPASELAIVPEAPLVGAESATAVKPPAERQALSVPPKAMPAESLQGGTSGENRYNYALHGVTCGSAAGGCIGSWTGLTYVRTEHPECSPSYSVYRIEPCVYWGAAIGATALGTGVGYTTGDNLDRGAVSLVPSRKEGRGWRTGCTIGAVVPGLILGTAFFAVAGGSYYGKAEELNGVVENDPSGLTYLPMALTGLCIVVEVATIGYRIGRSIDRRNAAKAEARRRALGH